MNAPFFPPVDSIRAQTQRPRLERVFVLGHGNAGLGRGEKLLPQLMQRLREDLPLGVHVDGVFLNNHAEVRAAAEAFCALPGHGCIVVAGGGGTFRAALEGFFAAGADAHSRIQLATLRMGSGNLLGKNLGIARNPLLGIQQIATALRSGQPVQGYAIRAWAGQADGSTRIHYAAALAGLGEIAALPLEVDRCRHTWLHRALCDVFPLERINDVEYAFSMVKRATLAAISPHRCAQVELFHPAGHRSRFRLLGGVCMALPVKNVPLKGMPELHEARVGLHLIPQQNALRSLQLAAAPKRAATRAVRVDLNQEERVTFRLRDREQGLFFLDEDVLSFHHELSLGCTSAIQFVAHPARSN